jgi:hypothetical protein
MGRLKNNIQTLIAAFMLDLIGCTLNIKLGCLTSIKLVPQGGSQKDYGIGFLLFSDF